MIASGINAPNFEFDNVLSLLSIQDHADIHNLALKSNNIVLIGSSLEIYQLASTLRTHLTSLDKNPKIIILDDTVSDMLEILGNKVGKTIFETFKAHNVKIV